MLNTHVIATFRVNCFEYFAKLTTTNRFNQFISLQESRPFSTRKQPLPPFYVSLFVIAIILWLGREYIGIDTRPCVHEKRFLTSFVVFVEKKQRQRYNTKLHFILTQQHIWNALLDDILPSTMTAYKLAFHHFQFQKGMVDVLENFIGQLSRLFVGNGIANLLD